ncbi:hypothetical protein CDAR_287701 [Caerostris darwini]|uniref:Uncharacterized protein n=1 Tax=Caerostris darwini TaxID=1538125 RepID=A0AAV4NDZ6_9ARAC|nr:hypothetical protein CDAR_287701 [Caerostris darwini]
MVASSRMGGGFFRGVKYCDGFCIPRELSPGEISRRRLKGRTPMKSYKVLLALFDVGCWSKNTPRYAMPQMTLHLRGLLDRTEVSPNTLLRLDYTTMHSC